MCSNQDARPFTDLKKDAEEFREKFDEDINECMSFLDKKITTLICDPDSLGHSTSVKQNALAEFSKAKYDVFISVKAMINKKEREWLNYMSEMKKLFIENVEIFLAGTKLEVKLPSLEFQSSFGHRKSPGNQKTNSTSATRSIYPLLTTLTKNIPGLGSPLRKPNISNPESEEINDVGSNAQFKRRSRLAVSIPKLSESQMDSYADFNNRSRLPTSSIKLAQSQRANTVGNSDSSDSSESEAKTENEAMDIEIGFDNHAVSKMTRRGRRDAKIMIENKKHESVPSYEKSYILNNDDDSESETPIARSTKSTARRKTLLPNFETIADAVVIPGISARSKSKRKTVGGSSELETIAPTKRLKVGIQKIVSSQVVAEENDDANDNLLESDDSYSEWMTLKRVDGKTPTRPAVYEVKVSRAKKPAYIGSCDSLRQKLTLYKLKQSSGHKHLDKFIERNYDDIQVRYEIITSLGDAEREVKDRIKSFVAQYKTTPAYN